MSQTLPELKPAKKVLVIDDEEAFCILLAGMLSDWGYKVVTSNQAKSAQLDEMTDSDIIFIDMMMPGMSGAENEVLATAEILAKRSDLRLIGVLNKPFRASDVLAVLEPN